MRVGVFTPLLSQLPLDEVLKKLKTHKIDTVELGTGNYPGDAHCKLSMLKTAPRSPRSRQRWRIMVFPSARLSCHGNPLHPDRDHARHDQEVSRKTIRLAEEAGRAGGGRFLRLPRRFAEREASQLGHVSVAAGLSRHAQVAVGESRRAVLDQVRPNSPPIMA